MKIMHVMAGAPEGGAETAFVDLCIAQQAHGHTVLAVCRPARRNQRLRDVRVPLQELPFGGWFDWQTTPKLRTAIRAFKPDAVVTWMARAAGKMPKRVAGDPAYLRVGRLGGYYDLKYYKGTDLYVVIAPDIGRWVQTHGIPESRVALVHNFAEAEGDATPVDRASIETTTQDFVFLSLARLHKNKGLDTLLEAFARVPHPACLWLAGTGPEEAALKRQAHNLGIEARVRFLGWRADRSALLLAADALVFPSRHEPFGTSFVQAWAQQKPLVTTASQGPKHYVQDRVNGLMVPIDDPDALSAAMTEIVKDRVLRERLVMGGSASYEAQFRRDIVLGRWDKVLAQALPDPQTS